MKKIVFLFCLLTNALFAQEMKQDELIGKWKVIEVKKNGKINIDEFKNMKYLYTDAIFNFSKKTKFTISLKNEEGNSEKYLQTTLKDMNWVFDPLNSLILIGNKKNDYATMKLKVVAENNEFYFIPNQSLFKLKVIKEK